MDENNWTPLHYAASGGSAKIVELLIQVGGKYYSRNYRKQTPLPLAVKNGRKMEIW